MGLSAPAEAAEVGFVDELEAITEPSSTADLLDSLVTLTVERKALGCSLPTSLTTERSERVSTRSPVLSGRKPSSGRSLTPVGRGTERAS